MEKVEGAFIYPKIFERVLIIVLKTVEKVGIIIKVFPNILSGTSLKNLCLNIISRILKEKNYLMNIN